MNASMADMNPISTQSATCLMNLWTFSLTGREMPGGMALAIWEVEGRTLALEDIVHQVCRFDGADAGIGDHKVSTTGLSRRLLITVTSLALKVIEVAAISRSAGSLLTVSFRLTESSAMAGFVGMTSISRACNANRQNAAVGSSSYSSFFRISMATSQRVISEILSSLLCSAWLIARLAFSSLIVNFWIANTGGVFIKTCRVLVIIVGGMRSQLRENVLDFFRVQRTHWYQGVSCVFPGTVYSCLR